MQGMRAPLIIVSHSMISDERGQLVRAGIRQHGVYDPKRTLSQHAVYDLGLLFAAPSLDLQLLSVG